MSSSYTPVTVGARPEQSEEVVLGCALRVIETTRSQCYSVVQYFQGVSEPGDPRSTQREGAILSCSLYSLATQHALL